MYIYLQRGFRDLLLNYIQILHNVICSVYLNASHTRFYSLMTTENLGSVSAKHCPSNNVLQRPHCKCPFADMDYQRNKCKSLFKKKTMQSFSQ